NTYLVLGALVWLIAIPGSIFTRFPPPERDAGPRSDRAAPPGGSTFGEALADRRLWLLVTAWLLLGFNQMMMSVDLVSYVSDRRGHGDLELRLALRRCAGTARGRLPLRRDGLLHARVQLRRGRAGRELRVLHHRDLGAPKPVRLLVEDVLQLGDECLIQREH